jgi:cell division protein FtsB
MAMREESSAELSSDLIILNLHAELEQAATRESALRAEIDRLRTETEMVSINVSVLARVLVERDKAQAEVKRLQDGLAVHPQ